MKCPRCGAGSSVIETENHGAMTDRVRRCSANACAHEWRSIEVPVGRSMAAKRRRLAAEIATSSAEVLSK